MSIRNRNEHLHRLAAALPPLYQRRMAGVLEGLRIVELAGIGPVPFAAMMLADHGATVIRVEREDREPVIPPAYDILGRGRASIVRLDLRSDKGAARVRELARDADGL